MGFRNRNKPETIMGWRIAPARFTMAAYVTVLKYIALPFLGVLALVDGILYFVFEKFLDRCFGLFCFF